MRLRLPGNLFYKCCAGQTARNEARAHTLPYRPSTGQNDAMKQYVSTNNFAGVSTSFRHGKRLESRRFQVFEASLRCQLRHFQPMEWPQQ